MGGQFDGTSWTFHINMSSSSTPVEVVLEYGPDELTWNGSVPVTFATRVQATVTLPDPDRFCVRFTATNASGTNSSAPFCQNLNLPSLRVVQPSG
jgi:hypothetical protein